MGGVNVILIVLSIQELVTHSGDDLKKFHLPSIIAVAAAFGTSIPCSLPVADQQSPSLASFSTASLSEGRLPRCRFFGRITGMTS